MPPVGEGNSTRRPYLPRPVKESAPQRGNQVDVLLHCIFRSGAFDRAPGIEFGAADEVELPGCSPAASPWVACL